VIFGEISERKRVEREMRDAGRLPPGQSLTLKWPVLHVGSVPRFDPAKWDFQIKGLVEQPVRLMWDEFTHLPMQEITADITGSRAGAVSMCVGKACRSQKWRNS
jgi:DMSO/TMAO reductase YedYZ molybdopterin-dependent catalytic subunit